MRREQWQISLTKWKVVVGSDFTVGIDSDGSLWSWGYNGNVGQLGDGTAGFMTENKSITRTSTEEDRGGNLCKIT